MKKLLSLLLVSCMVLSLGGITAWAEGTVIEGNITAEGQGRVIGLEVSSMNDSSVSVTGKSIIEENAGTVTVKGSITASADEEATGVEVFSSNAEITVDGAVSANAAEGDTFGISINAAGQYNAGVTVNGDVTASGANGTGVIAMAPGNGARAEGTVNGKVTTEDSNEARGLYAEGAGATVTVNGGDVTATSTGALGEGIYANNGSTVSVKAGTNGQGGNVTATGNDAIGIEAGGGSTVTAESVTANGDGIGVIAYGDSTVKVTGDVTGGGAGVFASGEKTEVTVGGDVTGGDIGVSAAASTVKIGTRDENGELTSGGKVTATGDEGVGISASDGTVTAGDVTASGEGATGIDASEGSTVTADSVKAENGTGIEVSGGSTVNVEGDVTAGDNGIEVSGGATVNVEGNVKAGENGIVVNDNGTVTIDGTLTVTGGTPILLGDEVTDAGDINITVWQIEGGTDGSVVSGGQGDAAEAVQQNINYIIKVVQPTEGVTDDVTATGENGSTSNDYNVANEGETVTIKVNLAKGYKLTGVFNGEGESKEAVTTQNEDGYYYITMPKGGGVYLSVELEPEAEPQPEPDPDDPKPEPEPVPEPKPGPGPEPEPGPEPKPEPKPIIISLVPDDNTPSSLPSGNVSLVFGNDDPKDNIMTIAIRTDDQVFLKATLLDQQKKHNISTVLITTDVGYCTISMDELLKLIGEADSFTLHIDSYANLNFIVRGKTVKKIHLDLNVNTLPTGSIVIVTGGRPDGTVTVTKPDGTVTVVDVGGSVTFKDNEWNVTGSTPGGTESGAPAAESAANASTAANATTATIGSATSGSSGMPDWRGNATSRGGGRRPESVTYKDN